MDSWQDWLKAIATILGILALVGGFAWREMSWRAALDDHMDKAGEFFLSQVETNKAMVEWMEKEKKAREIDLEVQKRLEAERHK